VSAQELARRLNVLDHAIADLVIVSSAMEVELPLYAVGTLTLAVASLGELVANRALEAYRTAQELRGSASAAAGLPSPELVKHVRALILDGRAADPGVGRWS
jgi:hypothetical protein